MGLLNVFVAVVLVMTSFSPMTSSASKHVAKVRLFVEQSAEENWQKSTGSKDGKKFHTELKSTFYEINQLLKSMKADGVDIQLQLADITVLNKNILSPNGNRMILDTVALETFQKYIEPTYKTNKYDMALLYTGYNLATSSSDGVAGYAYVESICSSTALGVIELKGVYMDVLLTAHEIGHILGSHHDGSSQARGCASNSGNIMNPVVLGDSPNHYYYSACSASQIKAKFHQLDQDGNNCMASWSASNDIKGPKFGSLMTPDEVCKRAYGQDKYVARKAYETYGDEVCVQLACMMKTQGYYFQWKFTATPPGMNCGKDKQCSEGRCVKSADGNSHVSDTCPFGDQPKIEGAYQMTCADMDDQKCESWKKTCCATCGPKPHKKGDPGTADEICKKLKGPHASLARYYYKSYGDTLCSHLTCLSRIVGYQFMWSSYQAPDGMKCGKNKRCAKGKCVHSSTGDPHMSDSCPYGDQPWLGGNYNTDCPTYVNSQGCGDAGWQKICCKSC